MLDHHTRFPRTFLLFAASLSVGTAATVLAANAPAAKDGEQPAETTPVEAGTTFDLRYKLATGTVLRYDVQHRAAIRSTIDDTTQEAQTRTDSIKLWKVTDVLPNGQIEFMNVVERVHMVNQLPDRAPTEYDSDKDRTPPPGYEDTAKAVGVPLSVVRMTSHGAVVSHKLKLQQTAERDAQITVRLPDKPTAIGATWDEPFEVTVQLQNGGTKSIQTRRHYKLADVAGGIATIEVTYQVLSPIDAHVESQLVQRLMKGTVRFDIENGRIAAQQFEVDKRVLGFAGPTSSMHYVMRMEEKLLNDDLTQTPRKVTRKPSGQSTSQRRPTSARTAGRPSGRSPR